MDGARSDLTRAGLGLDESEWDEPERLSSTPLPSPGGASSVGGERCGTIKDCWEATVSGVGTSV